MDIVLLSLNDWLTNIFEYIVRFFPPDIRGAFVGAIAGALAANWVSRRTLRSERVGKCWIDHRNSLVEIQPLIIEMIDIVSSNRTLSENIIATEIFETGIPFVWAKPHQFPTYLNKYFPFQRLDLINRLFSYNGLIRRINVNISNFNVAYENMLQAMLKNNIDRPQYINSLKEYQDSNKVLLKSYSLIKSKSVELLAHIIVALDNDNKFDNRTLYKLPKLKEISETDIQTKVKIINNEMEEVSKKAVKN